MHSLVHFTPDCSSWGLPARGTSLRSFTNVSGNVFLPWVQSATCMVTRTVSLLVTFWDVLGVVWFALRKETAEDHISNSSLSCKKFSLDAGAASTITSSSTPAF